MNRRIPAATAIASLALLVPQSAVASTRHHDAPAKPTVVLVHGAFADSSSWSAEIVALEQTSYPVVAVANPLRGVASDAAYLESVLATITGPIVLVGHSYAGFVISQAAVADPDVKALVYVAAYIPQPGETPADLTYRDPGSRLTNDNLDVRPSPSGTDLYIKPGVFATVYAGGLPPVAARTAAVVQRPITAEALGEPATVAPPAGTPKWEIVATEDHAIPTVTQQFMADRAGATVIRTRSGHDVPAAQPLVVTRAILDAGRSIR
jgi:pimeloyl-ACP methyl ester carboxylesterase